MLQKSVENRWESMSELVKLTCGCRCARRVYLRAGGGVHLVYRHINHAADDNAQFAWISRNLNHIPILQRLPSAISLRFDQTPPVGR